MRKQQVMLDMLAEGNVRVCLDASYPTVSVPPDLRHNVALWLEYSLATKNALEVDKSGISASLKFSGRKFNTMVPWEAVHAIMDYKGCGKKWRDIPETFKNGKAKPSYLKVVK